MLETMADPAQLPTPAPGAAEAAAPSRRDAAPSEAKAPATGDVQSLPPLNTPAADQVFATGTGAGAQELPAALTASASAGAAAGLLQPAADATAASPPQAGQASGEPKPGTDAALALLQQFGVPAIALAPQGLQDKQPANTGKQDTFASDTLPLGQVADASAQSAPALAPDSAQAAASAAAPQVPAGMEAQAIPAGAAIPAAPATPAAAAPVAIPEQAAAVLLTLPRPATASFQPAPPRASAATDTKAGKHADRAEALLSPSTSEPQGIAPPADKPVPLAASERKPDGGPVQHRSPGDWHAAFAENLSATPDPLAAQGTLTAGAGGPTLVTGSHATIVSDAAASASAAQNHLQMQQPVPLSGVPVLIAGRALAGDKHFDIRLDPPELGRIEVRLKVDRDGQISSHLIADRPDTLALLRRDGAGLERALQDAGLKTAGDGLQFSLRDQSGNGQADSRSANAHTGKDDASTPIDAIPAGYVRYSGRAGGLDIRV